jgi:hypothetical protein
MWTRAKGIKGIIGDEGVGPWEGLSLDSPLWYFIYRDQHGVLFHKPFIVHMYTFPSI